MCTCDYVYLYVYMFMSVGVYIYTWIYISVFSLTYSFSCFFPFSFMLLSHCRSDLRKHNENKAFLPILCYPSHCWCCSYLSAVIFLIQLLYFFNHFFFVCMCALLTYSFSCFLFSFMLFSHCRSDLREHNENRHFCQCRAIPAIVDGICICLQ